MPHRFLTIYGLLAAFAGRPDRRLRPAFESGLDCRWRSQKRQKFSQIPSGRCSAQPVTSANSLSMTAVIVYVGSHASGHGMLVQSPIAENGHAHTVMKHRGR